MAKAPNTSDVVKRLEVRATSVGVDQLTKDLERLAGTQKKTGQASLTLERSFAAQERSHLPLIAAQQRLARTAGIAYRAYQQGAVSADRAATLLGASGS